MKYFNGVKDADDARIRFFSLVHSKDQENYNEIFSEYKSIMPSLIHKDLVENDNRMTSHRMH